MTPHDLLSIFFAAIPVMGISDDEDYLTDDSSHNLKVKYSGKASVFSPSVKK